MSIAFQGHVVWPYGLAGDISLALLPIVIFLFLKLSSLLPKIGPGMKFTDYLVISLFILWMPNAAYCALEINHLFVIDHVADHPNIWSWVIFGGVSLIGLLAALYLGRLIISQYTTGLKEKNIYASFLGLINGAGAFLGLLGFYSQDVFTPAKYPAIIAKLSTPHPDLLVLSFSVAMVILICHLVLNLQTRRPNKHG